jgi:anti-sigma factor RsiW
VDSTSPASPLEPEIPPEPHPGPCVVLEARRLLLPYVLGGCAEIEAQVFEAHLLSCEACFQDVKLMDRAASLVRSLAPEGSPLRERVRALLGREPPAGVPPPGEPPN